LLYPRFWALVMVLADAVEDAGRMNWLQEQAILRTADQDIGIGSATAAVTFAPAPGAVPTAASGRTASAATPSKNRGVILCPPMTV